VINKELDDMSFEKLEKEKQNRIINAACEVFARHGYKKGSMKDIAEAAGISKSVLFKYFSTKQNLYVKVFRLASDSIREADNLARTQEDRDADMFSLMRRSAKTRLSLFKEYPWIYKFSYTAAFDGDPFVRELMIKELENYRQANMKDGQIDRQGVADDYKGLREDIPPSITRQIIIWISQGYLEERLYQDDIDPDGLEQGFEKWIDIMEILLKDNNTVVAGKEQKDR
jgi:TetR/AcrR family transcriptional regulator